jgi:carboxyl-terminal processing protease
MKLLMRYLHILLVGWVVMFGNQLSSQSLTRIKDVNELIKKEYFFDIDTTLLMQELTKEMVHKLDKYSNYYTVDESEYIWYGINYAGIGVKLNVWQDKCIVWEVVQGYDGWAKGLMIGDEIVSIDDSTTTGLSLDEITMKLRGIENTEVSLTVRRDEVIHNYTMTRKPIVDEPIGSYFIMDNNIGYINVKHFLLGSYEKAKSAIQTMGGNYLNGLVIDLRGNYGGVVAEALKVANLFLEKGSYLLSFDFGNTKQDIPFFAEEQVSFPYLPIVLLVDNKTISSGELLAAILQDTDRGLVVGDTTYGKGIVQSTYYTSDSSSVYMTVAEYKSPLGRGIQKLNFGNDQLIIKNKLMNDSVRYYTTDCGRQLVDRSGIVPDVTLLGDEYLKEWVVSKIEQDYSSMVFMKNAIVHTTFDNIVSYKLSDEVFNKFFNEFISEHTVSNRDFRTGINVIQKSIYDSYGIEDAEIVELIDRKIVEMEKNYLNNNRDKVRKYIENLIIRKKYGESTGIKYRINRELETLDLKKFFILEAELLNCKK